MRTGGDMECGVRKTRDTLEYVCGVAVVVVVVGGSRWRVKVGGLYMFSTIRGIWLGFVLFHPFFCPCFPTSISRRVN